MCETHPCPLHRPLGSGVLSTGVVSDVGAHQSEGLSFDELGFINGGERNEISLGYCGISGKEHKKREIILHCIGETSTHTAVVPTVI